MAKQKSAQPPKKRRPPAMTPEAREEQMINLAIAAAERQLEEGTASASVIVHYLKLGSTKERIEKEILSKQKDLIVAKTEALKSAKRMEELYAEAMNAMKEYAGAKPSIDMDEEDDE